MKTLFQLSVCFFIFAISTAISQDTFSVEKSVHLTFRVLGWQPKEALGIKYSERVPTTQAQADIAALAEVHGWIYAENDFQVSYEKGDRVFWQLGKLSEKEKFDTDFTLNFQALREQFSDADRIVIDILNSNGFTYHATFTPNTENWQNQLPFHKDWTDLSKYRLRYVLEPKHFADHIRLPLLKANAAFSVSWFFLTLPILVFFILLPAVTAYLFLRRGIARNKGGKITFKPIQMGIICAELHIATGAAVYLGYVALCAILTQSTLFGFLLSAPPIGITSLLIYARVLHRYEKSARHTTWSFQENLLTELRMIVLATPLLLLPFCYFGTLKAFPGLPFLSFLALLLAQYTLLTSLFACVIPFVMRWVWKGNPLSDTRLRNRLQHLAERTGLAYQNIVLLQTKRAKLANAWVAGILPKWRTIFLTDYLLEHLSTDEIQNIFAHELGHVKHRHLFKQIAWIVLGFGGQLALIQLSLFLVRFLPESPPWISGLLLVVANIAVMYFVMQSGLMHFWRRMEFEADAYAVELTQQPEVFLQALRKLIQLNDAPEDLDKFNEMLSTHPNFKARADAIEKLASRADAR